MEKEKEDIQELFDFSQDKKQAIIGNILEDKLLYDSADVSDDVYKDTCIDTWSSKLPSLDGGKFLMKKLVRNPIKDISILKQRQNIYGKFKFDFSILKEFEDDALWVYKLNEEVKNNNLINVLFPSMFLVSNINKISPLLDLYHIAKVYLVPINVVIYPFLSLLGPLYYFNKYLKFNISLSSYMKMLWKFVRFIFSYSGNVKTTFIKIFTIVSYILLFIYNAYQTIEYSYMLYKIRDVLFNKISNLNIFLKESSEIIKSIHPNLINSFVKLKYSPEDIIVLPDNFTSIYKIWKDQDLKDKISKILTIIYTLDVINCCGVLKNSKQWCLTNYSDTTKIWQMKNPVLKDTQVANPLDMSKNIIVTGPNAAGKTTYVKSILSNIILSQSLGLVNGLKSNTIVYDSIVSFMRITDIIGSKSYFEVEAEYCRSMMERAHELSLKNRKGLFLMDEPMHSTPPTEGMATAYAVVEYIGSLSNASIILTTHFHKLTTLEALYPSKFVNLSVVAHPRENGFYFPYKIQRGHSFQCIAIELLSSKQFPEKVIESAIKMKNKIYNEINSKRV